MSESQLAAVDSKTGLDLNGSVQCKMLSGFLYDTKHLWSENQNEGNIL